MVVDARLPKLLLMIGLWECRTSRYRAFEQLSQWVASNSDNLDFSANRAAQRSFARRTCEVHVLICFQQQIDEELCLFSGLSI